MKKILVIRFSSIGDIVLTTPVVRCLKTQVPGAEIHYLTRKHFSSILDANPYITKVHTLADSMAETITLLKAEKFDLVIDLHKNLRTLKVKSALKVKSYSFNKLNIEKWLLTSLKWNILPEVHIVDRYMQTASTLNVVNDGEGLDYFIPAADEVTTVSLPSFLHNGFAAIVVGAAHNTKKLPVEKWKDVCMQLKMPVVVLGGKNDNETGEALETFDSTRIYNACGKFSLNQSASLVQKSKLVISHDTGLMHIAAALRKPLIAIWGNTVPSFGMYPYYGNPGVPYFNAEVTGLPCRPCSKIGYRKCPQKHFRCMLDQDVTAIAGKANTFFTSQ